MARKNSKKIPKIVRSPIVECGGYYFAIAPLMLEVLRKEKMIREHFDGNQTVFRFT